MLMTVLFCIISQGGTGTGEPPSTQARLHYIMIMTAVITAQEEEEGKFVYNTKHAQKFN